MDDRNISLCLNFLLYLLISYLCVIVVPIYKLPWVMDFFHLEFFFKFLLLLVIILVISKYYVLIEAISSMIVGCAVCGIQCNITSFFSYFGMKLLVFDC